MKQRLTEERNNGLNENYNYMTDLLDRIIRDEAKADRGEEQWA